MNWIWFSAWGKGRVFELYSHHTVGSVSMEVMLVIHFFLLELHWANY